MGWYQLSSDKKRIIYRWYAGHNREKDYSIIKQKTVAKATPENIAKYLKKKHIKSELINQIVAWLKKNGYKKVQVEVPLNKRLGRKGLLIADVVAEINNSKIAIELKKKNAKYFYHRKDLLAGLGQALLYLGYVDEAWLAIGHKDFVFLEKHLKNLQIPLKLFDYERMAF